MASPARTSGHDQLVLELAALPEGERQAVIDAAERTATSRRAVASWGSIKAAVGIVRGASADAVADCAHLYDG